MKRRHRAVYLREDVAMPDPPRTSTSHTGMRMHSARFVELARRRTASFEAQESISKRRSVTPGETCIHAIARESRPRHSLA